DPCEAHGTPGAVVEELRTGEPDGRAAGGDGATTSGVSAAPDMGDTGTADLSCCNAVSVSAVMQDYSSQGGEGTDADWTAPEDSLRGSGDEREIIAGNGDESPSPVPVPGPEPQRTARPAASRQIGGLGNLSQREETRVTAGNPAREGDRREGGGPGAEEVDDGMMTMMMMDVMDSIPEVDELFLDAHPRVLFSPSASPPLHPPLLLMLESGALPEGGGAGGGGETDGEGHGHRRIRRADLSDLRRGERSVCESESVWVTDKKTAIDNHGRTVTILPVIQTPTGPLKQYFYETRCRRAEQTMRGSYRGGTAAATSASSSAAGGAGPGLGVAGSSCLGVDKKQWKSECKAKHSFVRALAKDANNRMGWRWIRIDSSCVCVLLARVNRQSLGKV
ncbi:hypothetical protein CRUP_021653, partial [Coryphaenoides rupestris]